MMKLFTNWSIDKLKKWLLACFLVILSVSISGCQQIVQSTKDKSFVEPEPSDWVKYNAPIMEYMYYRTQAVLKNDIEILWGKYPELKNNIDIQQGINVENEEVKSFNRNFVLLDANYHIESYDRMKVKTINENEVIVLVHGSLVYLMNDFSESGGEYLIEAFLEREGGNWTVVKTDEYTLSEYKDWVSEKN